MLGRDAVDDGLPEPHLGRSRGDGHRRPSYGRAFATPTSPCRSWSRAPAACRSRRPSAGPRRSPAAGRDGRPRPSARTRAVVARDRADELRLERRASCTPRPLRASCAPRSPAPSRAASPRSRRGRRRSGCSAPRPARPSKIARPCSTDDHADVESDRDRWRRDLAGGDPRTYSSPERPAPAARDSSGSCHVSNRVRVDSGRRWANAGPNRRVAVAGLGHGRRLVRRAGAGYWRSARMSSWLTSMLRRSSRAKGWIARRRFRVP